MDVKQYLILVSHPQVGGGDPILGYSYANHSDDAIALVKESLNSPLVDRELWKFKVVGVQADDMFIKEDSLGKCGFWTIENGSNIAEEAESFLRGIKDTEGED